MDLKIHNRVWKESQHFQISIFALTFQISSSPAHQKHQVCKHLTNIEWSDALFLKVKILWGIRPKLATKQVTFFSRCILFWGRHSVLCKNLLTKWRLWKSVTTSHRSKLINYNLPTYLNDSLKKMMACKTQWPWGGNERR